MVKFYLFFRTLMVIALVGTSTLLLAQGRTVTGTVLSGDDHTALPGVSIVEKGTTNGTVTDSNGTYSIKVNDGSTLVFSFVGYASQEVAVAGRTAIDLTLEADVTALTEVIVVGYGSVEKKDLTGSVVAIQSDKFNKGVMSSPQDLILGKVAGVQVTSAGGAPGSSSTIRIRGGSSVNANNDPLIVIDGFPIDNNTIGGTPNGLATINPNDIETMTVLKDASATAIYGSRASNGVIIVTTKKGKDGKPVFNYNGQLSVSTPIKYVDVLGATEYKDLITSLQGNYGIDANAISRLGNANTDWQKEIYRTAISNDHNLNMSGSTRNMPYRVSYGYTDQEGILKTTNMKRHSINLNFTPSFLDDRLKVTASFKGSYAKNNFGDQGAVGAAVSFDPTQPVYNNNTRYGGYFAWVADPTNPNSAYSAIAPRNPVAMLDLTNNTSNVYRGIGNLQLDYRFAFLPELRVNVNAGFDYSKSDGVNNVSKLAPWTSEKGVRNDYTNNNKSRLFDLYFNYLKQIGDHKIDATAGYSYQAFTRDGTSFVRDADQKTFSIYDIDYSDQSDSDGDTVAFKNTPNPNYLISFFGRVNYTYKGKYFLTGTLRTDGSSRFSKDSRWGMFPAVSAAWRIKDEEFLSGAKILSDLKIRAGWGVTGQQDVGGTYPYLPVYVTSTLTAQYQFGNTFYNTYRPSAYDASFKWEETHTVNVGADFGFLENKITGSVDYYVRKTKDLINTIPIPALSNFNNYLLTNVGDMENKGIEVMLNADILKTDNLKWTAGVNFSHNTNKITKLTATEDPTYQGNAVGAISGGVGNTIQNDNIGHPRNSFWVFQQVYDPQGKPIEGLYVDRTGNGGNVASDLNNKYYHHNPAPRTMMGLTSSLSYKNFDFFFSGRLSLDNYVYNNGAANSFYQSAFNSNSTSFNNLRTAIYDTNFATAQYWSDFYIENASFFKMDNISLGYTPANLMNNKLRARVSLTVQNAFIITKYNGLDPELSNGIDNNLYPRPRVFLLGVNLTY